jgi:2,3-dihydroxybiphenyl 1,2-dioxygenase
MTSIRLGYIGLKVSKPDAWHAYATNFLGMMAAAPSPKGAARYRLDDYAYRVFVDEGDLDDLSLIGLEVADHETLDAVQRQLALAGFAVAEGSAELKAERGVSGLYTTLDPMGIPVELYCGPTVVSHEPFASPTGVKFVTGEQGLGHLAVATSKLAETRNFYLDGLGFRQADTISMQLGPELTIELEFYYGNPRHHTVAIAPLPFPAPKRIHHMMLQVEELDQVGHTMDRAKANNVTLTQSLGRHSNDKMVSFYCSTPSGFELEYGYGAIEVHEEDWTMARHDRISAWGHHRL